MTLSVIILSGEKALRNNIRILANEFLSFPSIHDAKTVKEAASFLSNKKIDMLFWDSKIEGIEVAQLVAKRQFALISVIDHKSYNAINSENDGLYYLFKPVNSENFRNCIHDVTKKSRSKTHDAKHCEEVYLKRKLRLKHQQGIHLVTLKEIIYLEASNSYTLLYLINGHKITIAKAINKFESTLDRNFFFRIHKSYLINLFHVKEYTTREGGAVIMSNSERLAVSRYRLSELLVLIEDVTSDLEI